MEHCRVHDYQFLQFCILSFLLETLAGRRVYKYQNYYIELIDYKIVTQFFRFNVFTIHHNRGMIKPENVSK